MSRLPALPVPPKNRISPNHPEPGYWTIQYVKGGPVLPCAIYRINHEPGSENDPDGPNMLNTGPILIANVGYHEAEPEEVWIGRRLRAITEKEYSLMMRQLKWDIDYDRTAPVVRPKERVELDKLKPIGPKP